MKRTILLFMLSLIHVVSQSAERYNFSHLSLEDGLSQITITAIFQDSKGYMWFGTRNGLNRYNGYSIEVFLNDPENSNSLSNNHIMSITEDNDGNLWVGTYQGLNKIDITNSRFVRYYSSVETIGTLSSDMISSLYFDEAENILWVGTTNGLNRYNHETDSFYLVDPDNTIKSSGIYEIIKKDEYLYLGTISRGVIIFNPIDGEVINYNSENNELPHNDVRTVFVDKNDNIWIGTHHNGIALLKKGESKFIYLTQKDGLSSNYIRNIKESPDGEILVGTFNGLNLIDPVTQKIIQYSRYGVQEGFLSHYSIYNLYFDRSKTLWVGTYSGGINYHSDYGQKFHFYTPGSDLRTITGVLGPITSAGEKLYIATEGGGLLEMNPENDNFEIYKILEGEGYSYSNNIIKSIYHDNGRILCGTNVGTIYSFDLKTKKISLFYKFNDENSVYQIIKSVNGDLLILGVNNIGLTKISPEGKVSNSFPLKDGSSHSFYNTRCIYEINQNEFLIGTRTNGLFRYNMDTGELDHYTAFPKDENQLQENYITCIYKDSMGRIWIGTYGGGLSLYNPLNGSFKNYYTGSGLQENSICTILEDGNHHLWISTFSGITDFNPESGQFNNYSYSGGIKVNEFTPNAGFVVHPGRIIFSGNNGIVSFNPRRITINPYIPPIILENLYVYNEKVSPHDASGILNKQLNNQGTITLKHNQSNFTIEYAALNFIFSDRNMYSYKLDGFDAEWIDAGTRRTAYYTNIPAGKYKFMVRASNNDGLWNREGNFLYIIVRPPLWKTWWAYLIYFTIIGGVTYLIIRYFNERKRLENEFKLKQAEARAREEFHQERTNLFTNFSHELRTPLTLIISPLEELINTSHEIPGQIQKVHTSIYNNSLRLLRLVNNLMDFRKKESGKLKIQVCENDFVQFTKEMTHIFGDLAAARQIKFELFNDPEKIPAWFDRILMEKVFFNFLSNAFKNVPNNGSLSIKIREHSLSSLQKELKNRKELFFTDNGISYILVEIQDNGPGIEENELEKIFTPFYQVARNEHSASGTGLGLSLSKSIIELHHGIVWAEKPENEGALFRFILPVNAELFKPEEFAPENILYERVYTRIESVEKQELDRPDSKKTHRILVIEDNMEIRKYITSLLNPDYLVTEAGNGKEAIDKAIDLMPDLIVSDLMMPRMDGLEMTQILKKDLRTSHIPVILLTARTMDEDIRAGYEIGADDYITKPFSPQILKARVDNLIQSREQLKNIFGKRFSLDALGVEKTSADDRFLQKLYESLEKNIANPNLSLDNFSKEIGMSRANMYRKVKAITDMSPTEFIRNFRLEMAARVLKEAKLPVSEIYVAVGFSSHAYFSSCFKNLYGMTPTEYTKSQKA